MRLVRFLIGFALLPLCVAGTRAVIQLAESIQPSWTGAVPPAALAIGAGFFVWILVYFIMPRPVRTYILAHELTHALWAWLMGAEVSKLKVSKNSGSVTISKSNFLITLAPYFFPLYTVITVAAYLVMSVFVDVEKYYLFWLFVVGITWGFHFTFTITTLMQKQSDIRECGHLFSYAFIYLMNVLGIGLWLVLVSSATLEDLAGYLGESAGETIEFCKREAEPLMKEARRKLQ